MIPFNDLYSQYLSIKREIDDAIENIIRRSAFIRGDVVENFESSFAAELGSKYCVSCGNGTDALYIAMKALGLKKGDEVIVPAMSWISTSETVSQAGGRVVFCDIDSNTNTLDPFQIENHITDRTVGIIPVHLYGQACDMRSIMSLAEKHRLWVIEDCAQAHLAEFEGRKTGTFGAAATFSFYPGKNLGAMGDAGAILTDDSKLSDEMAKFARHGGLVKGQHEIEGINSRLDGLQAAILNVKLPHLQAWTDQRRDRANYYLTKLRNLESLHLPVQLDQASHVWHIFQVRAKDRDGLRKYLTERDVQTSINYPCALPFLPCYKSLGHEPLDFPNAVSLSHETLSLPLFPSMTIEQQDVVCRHLKEWTASSQGRRL